MSKRPPNLMDSHFVINAANGMTVLAKSDRRYYFMIINHDAQPIEIHMGPGDVTQGLGIIIPAGGHLMLPDGVLGPIQIMEDGGGAANVTVLSPIDEESLASVEPTP